MTVPDMVMADDGSGYLEVGTAAGVLLRVPLSALYFRGRYDPTLLDFSVQPYSEPDDDDEESPTIPRQVLRLTVELRGEAGAPGPAVWGLM